jgi:hypothetical protein
VFFGLGFWFLGAGGQVRTSSVGLQRMNAAIRGLLSGSEYCQEWPEVQAAACGCLRHRSLSSERMAECRGHHSCTRLMAAAGAGFHTVVAELLRQEHADVEGRGKNGKTALMLAARGDHCRAMKMLLDSEADPNAVDKYRWTALMDAANWGNIRACEVLLDAGADVHMAGIQVCHLCHLTFATS